MCPALCIPDFPLMQIIKLQGIASLITSTISTLMYDDKRVMDKDRQSLAGQLMAIPSSFVQLMRSAL
jgi:hypothetical protein